MSKEATKNLIGGRSADEIVRSIETAISAGGLHPGDRLPAVRKLAADLGVSPATAAAAYQALQRRGIVVASAGRRGTRVAERPPLGRRMAPPALDERARNVADGNPSPEFLPDLEKFLHRLRYPDGPLYGGETEVPGLVERAREIYLADGIAADALTVTSGALDAIENVLSSRLRVGDAVAVEDPAYPAVLDLVQALALKPVPVLIDDQGPLPGSLTQAMKQGAVAAIVTPRAQNPFGAALSPDRCADLAAVLNPYPEVLLIEDDHAAAVSGAPPATLTTGRRDWAVVRSVTKTYGPDLRLAFVSGDEATIAAVQGRLAVGSGWVSTVLQRLVLMLMRDRQTTRLIDTARRSYHERRAGLVAELGLRGVEAHGRSGFNVWIPVPDEASALTRLGNAGWAAAPGAPGRSAAPAAIRVTTAALPVEDIPELATAIVDAISPQRRARGA